MTRTLDFRRFEVPMINNNFWEPVGDKSDVDASQGFMLQISKADVLSGLVQ